jgi:hypothetical protein
MTRRQKWIAGVCSGVVLLALSRTIWFLVSYASIKPGSTIPDAERVIGKENTEGLAGACGPFTKEWRDWLGLLRIEVAFRYENVRIEANEVHATERVLYKRLRLLGWEVSAD